MERASSPAHQPDQRLLRLALSHLRHFEVRTGNWCSHSTKRPPGSTKYSALPSAVTRRDRREEDEDLFAEETFSEYNDDDDPFKIGSAGTDAEPLASLLVRVMGQRKALSNTLSLLKVERPINLKPIDLTLLQTSNVAKEVLLTDDSEHLTSTVCRVCSKSD